ncbi:epoxide hydrolase A [Manihot esculenta]|uniref:soluble epoxide hydrolase n=1 Tax=Manihot esculenta TaxID=3983 RepID=A0A2C9WPI9_MANES|nr:epoxide hydrolase A [Manihot esculenta]OAY61849.1 hypothetical protein MANES_01G221400v8 [Manihot esculenta]
MDKIDHITVATNGINMHVAIIGTGPTILFLHGFPELWYSWRYQLLSLSSLGYRCIAPDLRGFGDTDAPSSMNDYTGLHVVGDLVGLLDALEIEQVFLVGHDWGTLIAWYFCLFRPDRIRALVSTSVAFSPRNQQLKPMEGLRAMFGDDYYICRFQEPIETYEEFAGADTATLLRTIFTARDPNPPCLPKGIEYKALRDLPCRLPSWLSEEDINYYATKFNQKGFTGGLNYYRSINLTWELMAPWTGVGIRVPVKFIVGDLDTAYHLPGVKEYIANGGFKKDVPLLQEVVIMEGVGHFINQEKAGEVSRHIHEFIKKVLTSDQKQEPASPCSACVACN